MEFVAAWFVAVRLYILISVDYTVNRQHLALFEVIWEVRCTQLVLHSFFIAFVDVVLRDVGWWQWWDCEL